MTVVTFMIFRAFSLDSWMPIRFWRKKYSVMAQAMTTEPQLFQRSRVLASMSIPVK